MGISDSIIVSQILTAYSNALFASVGKRLYSTIISDFFAIPDFKNISFGGGIYDFSTFPEATQTGGGITIFRKFNLFCAPEKLGAIRIKARSVIIDLTI